jgi:pimeloyl-ACP methyl ester carboxylesterase
MPLAGDGAMKVIGVGGVPTATRVSLRHHVVDLAEGHRAGVHVAGAGVPLVFLHGIGLDSRVYSGLLESLPQLGFLTVAIDAPAHGDTPALSGRPSFGERAEFLNLVLDELGIRRAVLVGHSMGGRNVLEIAASRPDRVIAAVLLNAAAGHTFDSDERPAAIRLSTLVAALLRAGWDARSGLGDLRALDRKTYLALRNKFSCQALRSAAKADSPGHRRCDRVQCLGRKDARPWNDDRRRALNPRFGGSVEVGIGVCAGDGGGALLASRCVPFLAAVRSGAGR